MVWVLGAALAAGVTGDLRVAVASVFVLANWVRRSRASRAGMAALLVTAVAFGSYAKISVSGLRRDMERVRRSSDGGEIRSLEGWVASFPAYRYGGMSFDFETRVEGVSCVVRVRTQEFVVGYGDSLRIEGKWWFPRSNGASYERRLMGQGVCGDFRATPGGVERLRGTAGSWLTRRVLGPCHEEVRSELGRGLGARCGFPIAVLLGETGYLDRKLGDAFTELGITHLIALSGQHLCFIAGAVMLALRCLRRRSTAALLVAITLYVGVVGFIVSLWRSFVMALVIALGGALRRPLDPVKVLGEAFVIVLLFYPHTYYSVGFQLSFLATLALLVAVRAIRPPSSQTRAGRVGFWVRASLQVSVAAQLVVTPVLIHYFGRVSVLAPLATLVFTFPVAFVLLYSGFAAVAAAAIPLAGPALFTVLDRVVGLLDLAVVVSAKLVSGTISPPPPEAHVYYAGLALVAFSRGQRWRRIAGWSLLAASFPVGALRRQLF